jgi:hypothetical protein
LGTAIAIFSAYLAIDAVVSEIQSNLQRSILHSEVEMKRECGEAVTDRVPFVTLWISCAHVTYLKANYYLPNNNMQHKFH